MQACMRPGEECFVGAELLSANLDSRYRCMCCVMTVTVRQLADNRYDVYWPSTAQIHTTSRIVAALSDSSD